MASIDDFIDHRWADAYQVLIRLDKGYVDRLKQVDSSSINLEEIPKKRLSTEWHRLFESCNELIMQSKRLQLIASNLTSQANARSPVLKAGELTDFLCFSWPIHAITLADLVKDVIRKTVAIYVRHNRAAKKIYKPYEKMVEEQVNSWIRKQRNDYVHANNPSATEITKDNNWEPTVVLGPNTLREGIKHYYESTGCSAKMGDYNLYFIMTVDVINRIGTILHDFEEGFVRKQIESNAGEVRW